MLEADILLVRADAPDVEASLSDVPAVRIVDLPPPTAAGAATALDERLYDAADLFVCRSEAERELWLGILQAAGRVDGDAYRIDPTLRRLIDVVSDADAPAAILAVCEEPWRWTSVRRRGRRRLLPTEDVQLALARRRAAAARVTVEAPPHEPAGVAQRVWQSTPEVVRKRLRPLLQQLQARRTS